MTTPNHPQSNDLAIASLVLGILSFTGMGPLTGIPAIITGVMGMKNPYNKGMAVAGLIMGIISTVFVVLGVLLFVLLLLFGVFAASSIDDVEYRDRGDDPASSHLQQRA